MTHFRHFVRLGTILSRNVCWGTPLHPKKNFYDKVGSTAFPDYKNLGIYRGIYVVGLVQAKKHPGKLIFMK